MTEDAGRVLPASAWEAHGPQGSIVQTAGIFDKPADAVKQGVNKVSEAITPTPLVTPSDDPTLLATKSKPTPELYLSLARYQEELGKPAMAEQSYQQALRMAPKHLGAHLGYARFKERQGQAEQALQLYQKAVKLYPNAAAALNDMGLLYARHGKNTEALKAYGRAIEIQPKRALYRNNMAVLLVAMGQPDQALTHLKAAYPEADACYKLAYLLQEKGQTHQAMNLFSRALAVNPSMNEARVWLDHLRGETASTPEVARKLPDAGSDRPPQPRIPPQDPDVKPNDKPLGASLPGESGSPEAHRGSVRPLPPVVKPLPAATSDSPRAPDTAPTPGPRRLPPTSSQRPTTQPRANADTASGLRRLAESEDDLLDAPLPVADPGSGVRRVPAPPSTPSM
jgi:tetratricopeptide (TPR) repeat protein